MKINKKSFIIILSSIISVLLIAAICLTIFFMGGEAPKKKKKIKKVVVIKKPEIVQNDDQAGDSEDEQDYGNGGSENDGLADGLFYVARKVTKANIGENFYIVTLKNDHPGVVGMDADYEIVVYNKMGHKIPNEELNISLNNNNLKINDGIVTIPYNTRISKEKVVVNVSNKKMKNLTGTYTFDFQQFTASPTFKDDFNSLDSENWAYLTDVTKNRVSVEDGCLVLSNKAVTDDVYLTSVFKQAYGCFSADIIMPAKGLTEFTASLYTEQRYIKNELFVSDSGGEIEFINYFPHWGNRWANSVRWHGWGVYSKVDKNDELICDTISSKLHKVSVVWTPEEIYWYLDGDLVSTYTGEGVYDGSSKMNIRFNLKSFDENSYNGVYDPNAFPFSAKIDCVEVYGLIKE